MGNDHLKRIAAHKAWPIKRKGMKFVAKSSPGPHSLETGIPLSILLKEVLNYAGTTREIKKIISMNDIKIDGKSRKDLKFPVGIFDTIEFANSNEGFRVVFNRRGKLGLVK